MVEAVMLWNEPNNLSHWDFKADPEWKRFAEMTIAGAKAARRANPELPIVLGGISPIDPNFMQLMGSHGVLDHVDIVAVHGFPLGLESLGHSRMAAEDCGDSRSHQEADLGFRGRRLFLRCRRSAGFWTAKNG